MAGGTAGRALAERTRWFTEARFGLFIHWGIYSVAGRHEWVKSRERLTDEQYQPYFDHFDPDLYDPAAWADEAWRAGMRYFVITTKHHDGFCLWDTALTDYKAPNTPHGKDVLAAMVTAFRERGFRIGFYHSLLDWHHPEFPVDRHHPRRDDPDLDGADRDISRYTDYLHGQVRELLTNYGRIDIMWFDFSYPGPDGKGRDDWRSAELVELVRSLQPHIMLNNRLDLGTGDVTTPEQVQPAGDPSSDVDGTRVPWEACQTINGSWGYDRDNHDDKSPELLVRMLVDGVSKGGNMLLNVGPTGRGEFDPTSVATLRGIGDWMRRHERSIRGAGASAYQPPPDCRYTQRGDRLYLHLFAWPMRHVHLPGLAGRVRYAQLLNDGSEVTARPTDTDEGNHTPVGVPAGSLTLELPIRRPDVAVPVVELFLRD